MFGKKAPESKLDQILTEWKVQGGRNEPLTYADATRGIQIYGGSGMGKSSGPGKQLALAFLKKNLGGLVLCAKPGEGKTWVEYIEEAGRTSDLVYFTKESGLYFNPLIYETSREGEGAGETLVLVDMIMNIYLLGRNFMAGESGGGGEAFWENAMRRLLSRSIDLLKLAEEPITFLKYPKTGC